MDFKIDPNASLADIQLACFMAAITALVELAKNTDKDHIKLRALTEVARLCNPAKLSPPTPHGTPSASDGPHALDTTRATCSPHAPLPVARARGSEGVVPETPHHGEPATSSPSSSRHGESPEATSCSLPLNRRQRRFLARLEANDRKREARCAA